MVSLKHKYLGRNDTCSRRRKSTVGILVVDDMVGADVCRCRSAERNKAQRRLGSILDPLVKACCGSKGVIDLESILIAVDSTP